MESDVQEYLENPENTYIFQMRTIDYLDFDPCDIRDAFLEFNASFMKNYNKFWVKTGIFRTRTRRRHSTATETNH